MVKAFHKTVYRMFRSNVGRFVANFLIVLISIGISAGLANLPTMYQESYARNYSEGNVSDVILKEKTGKGFTDDDLAKVKETDNVKDAYMFTCMDLTFDDRIYRFYITDLHQETNRITLVEGEYPSEKYDVNKDIKVLAHNGSQNHVTFNVGSRFYLDTDSLSILGIKKLNFVVGGVVDDPLYNSSQNENANLADVSEEVLKETYIDAIFYVDKSLVPESILVSGFEVKTSSLLVNTDIYVRCKDKSSYFSKEYETEMEKKKTELVSLLGEDRTVGLTLEENVSYALFKSYNKKVKSIAYIFPFFFILVSALVNSITMSRLIKDERKMIATYVSLGISKTKIVLKYLLFTFVSTLMGSAIGFVLGIFLIPPVVLPAYQSVFQMGEISFANINLYGVVSAVAVVLISLLVTLVSSILSLHETPASLMKDKSPKPGKKILLQRIPFIWKPLSFKYKSSLRNIFRQKKNFILTSLSIIGACLLIFIGFALLDVSNSLIGDALFGSVASSMGLISFVIIMFAVSMGVVVIYSLVNMNVSERQREIATLKVLGYHDRECLMYCSREIVFTTTLATLVGLPLSAWIVSFVFDYLEFGSISDVKWYSYLFTFVIILGMTIAINLLLYPKIRKVDMNDSLKTLE
jgi:putative ABC transport system permease protein